MFDFSLYARETASTEIRETSISPTSRYEAPTSFKSKLKSEIRQIFESLDAETQRKIVEKFSMENLSKWDLNLLESEIIFEGKVKRGETKRCT